MSYSVLAVVSPAVLHVRQSQHRVLQSDLYQCLLLTPNCAALDRDSIHDLLRRLPLWFHGGRLTQMLAL